MLRKYTIYIIIIAILLGLSLAGIVWTVTTLDPDQNAVYSLGLFYASVWIFIFSFICQIGFWIRRRWGAREMIQQQFKVSVRQGILIAILAVASLVLQSFRLFGWVNICLLLFALVFLEFYFISTERKKF